MLPLLVLEKQIIYYGSEIVENVLIEMGATTDAVYEDINRCYNGCQMTTGVNTTYTELEEQETLIDMENSIFCESTNSEVDYFLVFGTVELENSL